MVSLPCAAAPAWAQEAGPTSSMGAVAGVSAE
jgi:hypothetical protein